MNREEFRIEMHNYIDDLYDDYQKQQNILKETFKEVHRVCLLNNIPYFLGWGSLLGLVRDGDDVLPWDSDYDINVPFEYIPQLIEALKRDLSPQYYFVSNYTTPNYKYYQIRVTQKGLNSDHSHVDIFYMIPVAGSEEVINKKRKMAQSLFRKRVYRYSDVDYSNMSRIRVLAGKTYRAIMKITLPEFYLKHCFKKIINNNGNTAKSYLIFGENSNVLPLEIFAPAKTLNTGNVNANVPNDFVTFLSMVYGDYTKYPSIKSRFDQFYISALLLCRLSK